MDTIGQLATHGQAIWLDYIRRSLITSGELRALVEKGVRGVTSNPAIFNQVIAGSSDYDDDMSNLVDRGTSDYDLYEALVFDDIRRAADVLRPLYDETSGGDGYVSLEVRPSLAYETEGTVREALELFAKLDRPNVMIKVPATDAGIPAIERLTAEGLNVNVTLIFSVEQYRKVAAAYINGMEQLVKTGGDARRVASVASFFISRIDTALDPELEKAGAQELRGCIAIANAKAAYAEFRPIFSGQHGQLVAGHGGRVQRVLWASTGTKNPDYSDVLYTEALIGPDTVNTLPPATLQAFLDHGHADATLAEGLDKARAQLARLADLGIDLSSVLAKLQEDGVHAFQQSFDELMASIAGKRQDLTDRWQSLAFHLGSYQPHVDQALSEMRDDGVMGRIWAHDHTVWKPAPEEISNRLGWLHIAEIMADNVDHLELFAREVSAAGYTRVLLLGMGGSSLAPEVFAKIFHATKGYPELAVLDSTDPGAIAAHRDALDPARTLFIVSTKSGGTVETLSFFKYFYNWMADVLGKDNAGQHFVAITDPGSSLVDLAARYGFRKTFLNEPNIGGRYAVLSYVGLVPAALIGMDLRKLLQRALVMTMNCASCNCPVGGNNEGARLGAAMAALANAGRDKVTLCASSDLEPFGDWVEQLIAESTGKEGRGILPVVGEEAGMPEHYGTDRLFVFLVFAEDETYTDLIAELKRAGHPVIVINVRDRYSLGGQFLLWEMATAVAGYRLGINPFDQPDVESAKVLAREMVDTFRQEGVLPSERPTMTDGKIEVYGGTHARTAGDALVAFIAEGMGEGAYVSIHAYIQPTSDHDKALSHLRTLLRDRFRGATTLGYGPRFLHSTGQLHKGDAGHGLFVQITSAGSTDLAIPDEGGRPGSSMSFGILKQAQAMGDRQALMNAGRRVIHIHLTHDVTDGLKRLAQPLG
jgi:transaldolase/glucose-6-phosphate isomerase